MSTREDLENLVKPLIKEATRIICKKSSKMPENSHLKSHFGGQPYFEKGEEWPTQKDCNLEFVFQIFNEKYLQLPDNIKLLQFFYDFELDQEGGWFIKIYETINPENYLFIKKPKEHNKVKYCEIEYKQIKSLPDWAGIGAYSKNAKELLRVLEDELDEDNLDIYNEIVKKLVGERPDWPKSQLGGYAQWIQSDAGHINKKEYSLLFQLASEEEPDLNLGDIYIFYNKDKKEIDGTMQCC